MTYDPTSLEGVPEDARAPPGPEQGRPFHL